MILADANLYTESVYANFFALRWIVSGGEQPQINTWSTLYRKGELLLVKCRALWGEPERRRAVADVKW